MVEAAPRQVDPTANKNNKNVAASLQEEINRELQAGNKKRVKELFKTIFEC